MKTTATAVERRYRLNPAENVDFQRAHRGCLVVCGENPDAACGGKNPCLLE